MQMLGQEGTGKSQWSQMPALIKKSSKRSGDDCTVNLSVLH